MSDTEPKCPECGVVGIEHFMSRRSKQRSRTGDPWFIVVYCDSCGYVYDVAAKHVFAQTTTRVLMPGDEP